MKAHGSRRERGAYYTPEPLARLLADWAIHSGTDVIIDPAAGRGELLDAAARRVTHLGGGSAKSIWGVEFHPHTFLRLGERCRARGIPIENVLKGDFFELCGEIPECDVILANPPYVRHHDVPVRALARMREAVRKIDVKLDGKASSWAYFVIRSVALLRTNGRLGAVLPGDLINTDYGRQVLEYLRQAFRRVLLVYCNGSVFEDLQLKVVLVLAEGYGAGAPERDSLRIGSITIGPDTPSLPDLADTRDWTAGERGPTILNGRAAGARELMQRLRGAAGLRRLGEVAKLSIGYVAGDTQFFHLSDERRRKLRLPKSDLKRVVCRGSQISGTVFTDHDWLALSQADERCWLLYPRDDHSTVTRKLIRRGSRHGVSRRAKCASRRPWWRIGLGDLPCAFMHYMGTRPRIITNIAGVYASNSLYSLSGLHPNTAASLSVCSITSVFQMDALLEARELGGGLRKLEPRDAKSLQLPAIDVAREAVDNVDRLVRCGEWSRAIELADEIVLEKGLGWEPGLIRELQAGLRALADCGRSGADGIDARAFPRADRGRSPARAEVSDETTRAGSIRLRISADADPSFRSMLIARFGPS